MTKSKQIKHKQKKDDLNTDNLFDIRYIIENIILDSDNNKISAIPVVKLTSLVPEDARAPKVFILPGLDGTRHLFTSFSSNLKAHVFCLQYTNWDPNLSIENVAELVLIHILKYLSKSDAFALIGYSYGGLVSIEVMARLESQGYIGNLIQIDTTLNMIQNLSKSLLSSESITNLLYNSTNIDTTNEEALETTFQQFEEALLQSEFIQGGLEKLLPSVAGYKEISVERKMAFCFKYCLRIMSCAMYEFNFPKLKSKVILFRGRASFATIVDVENSLEEHCEQKITEYHVEGDHLTILINRDVANKINNNIFTV